MPGFDIHDPAEVDRLWHELQAHVRRRVDDVHDADDIVQETWLRALRQPTPPRVWDRWFERVARRLVHEIHRSERSRTHRERTVARPEFEAVREPDEQLEQLVRWIAELPAPYGPVVTMRYLEGREIAEIALRRGTGCSTVRSQLKRGIDKLRLRMRERDPTARRGPPVLERFAPTVALPWRNLAARRVRVERARRCGSPRSAAALASLIVAIG